MLSGPRQLVSAEQTFGYFLHEYLARNDSSHRTANRWHGRGAEALGLPQRVESGNSSPSFPATSREPTSGSDAWSRASTSTARDGT